MADDAVLRNTRIVLNLLSEHQILKEILLAWLQNPDSSTAS